MANPVDDDGYYYICWRLKLESETENMGVCAKERKGVAAEVLMATPCTNSLGGESEGHKHEGCGGSCVMMMFITIRWRLKLVCITSFTKTKKTEGGTCYLIPDCKDCVHRESVSGWAGFRLGFLIVSCTANSNLEYKTGNAACRHCPGPSQ